MMYIGVGVHLQVCYMTVLDASGAIAGACSRFVCNSSRRSNSFGSPGA